MSTEDVRCSIDELSLLRPVDEMSPVVRLAATRWLWEHDITPTSVALGLPIERDDVQAVLVWRELEADGSVTKRWRYAANPDAACWPAPFPPALLGADPGAAGPTHDQARTRTR